MSDNDSVRTRAHGRVLVITIDRPDVRNVIDNSVADGLVAAGELLDGSTELAVGVLTGAGSSFCAGMDLKAFVRDGVPKQLHPFYINGTAKPLVAAVEGYALGGGLELALTCDLIVAARGARLGVPEVTVGLFAAGGGVLRLGRRLPAGIAMEMAMTGMPIDAERASQYGLVNKVTEDGAALDAALELAEVIARNAPLAVSASKELIRGTSHMAEPEFWTHQISYSRKVLKSKDAKEGPRAFAEKRQPQWTGT
jgi:enoyl-CoA hydratase